jgi:hypothetical protein
MALLVPNVGETELLSRMLNKSTTGDVKIHLYSDDVTPAEGDTVSSYTLITDPAAISLTGSSWSVTDGTASYAQQTFTFSGSATAYGYVVTDAAGTTLLWSERFTDGPYTIPAGGGTIKITPTISLD